LQAEAELKSPKTNLQAAIASRSDKPRQAWADVYVVFLNVKQKEGRAVWKTLCKEDQESFKMQVASLSETNAGIVLGVALFDVGKHLHLRCFTV
jgi:hypothetical protein